MTTVAEGTEAASDRREVFDAEWVDPRFALESADAGDRQIEFPTRVHLELLTGFEAADDVMEHARRAAPHRIEPRMVTDPDGFVRIELDGEGIG